MGHLSKTTSSRYTIKGNYGPSTFSHIMSAVKGATVVSYNESTGYGDVDPGKIYRQKRRRSYCRYRATPLCHVACNYKGTPSDTFTYDSAGGWWKVCRKFAGCSDSNLYRTMDEEMPQSSTYLFCTFNEGKMPERNRTECIVGGDGAGRCHPSQHQTPSVDPVEPLSKSDNCSLRTPNRMSRRSREAPKEKGTLKRKFIEGIQSFFNKEVDHDL